MEGRKTNQRELSLLCVKRTMWEKTQSEKVFFTGNEERSPIYEEIQDGFVLQPTNGER